MNRGAGRPDLVHRAGDSTQQTQARAVMCTIQPQRALVFDGANYANELHTIQLHGLGCAADKSVQRPIRRFLSDSSNAAGHDVV